MFLRGFPVVAFATTLLVCCWQERASERESRQLVVAENTLSATDGKLVLRDPSCTITVTRSKTAGRADLPCLGALVANSAVEYSKRRMKQGCMPGKVYWTYAG